jgi:hypothetical protein
MDVASGVHKFYIIIFRIINLATIELNFDKLEICDGEKAEERTRNGGDSELRRLQRRRLQIETPNGEDESFSLNM